LDYEVIAKIKSFSFDQQHNKYVVALEGDGFNDLTFFDNIRDKTNGQLSYYFNIGDKIIINRKVGEVWMDVIAEVTDLQRYKNDEEVNTNISQLSYKLSNDETGVNNWNVKKVHKKTPLTPMPDAGKKKYTLEEDSKYRFKYAKYKAKYLIQKNNLNNN
jgi:hypothetical protein